MKRECRTGPRRAGSSEEIKTASPAATKEESDEGLMGIAYTHTRITCMHIIHITYHKDTTHTYHMHSYQITCHHIAHVYGSCTSYSHTSHTPTTYTYTTYHHILNYEVGPETSKKKYPSLCSSPSPNHLLPGSSFQSWKLEASLIDCPVAHF